MRWHTDKTNGKFHLWFAWYPVKDTHTHCWVWFETVNRRWNNIWLEWVYYVVKTP